MTATSLASPDLARTWAYRAARERESALRFRRIAQRLRRMHAAHDLIDAALRSADDELRHASACQQLASVLAGPSGTAPPFLASSPESPLPEVAPADFGLAERALFELVAFCCVCETLNVALLTAELREMRHPETERVTRDVLRDEVTHARFGWAALERFRAHPATLRLVPHLPDIVAIAVREEALDGAADHPGVLSSKRRAAVFAETIHHVVTPGLARYGLHL